MPRSRLRCGSAATWRSARAFGSPALWCSGTGRGSATAPSCGRASSSPARPWRPSAYLLGETAVTPLYGKLGDQLGRKTVLQSAVVLFLVGSALCGTAGTMTMLIAFRAVQGLGAGGLIVLVQSTVGDIVPPRERGRYQGLFGAGFGLASIAGPLPGGVVLGDLSRRLVFLLNP